MKRFLFIGVCGWVLLCPSLCLAGALEHLCSICPDGFCCSHEEACADDPCMGDLVRPDPGADAVRLVPELVVLPPGLPAESTPRFARRFQLERRLCFALGLSVHENDPPLLI